MAALLKINVKEDGFSITVEGVESETVDYGDTAELPHPHKADAVYLASVDIGEPGEKDAEGVDLEGQVFALTGAWAYLAMPLGDEEVEVVDEVEVVEVVVNDAAPTTTLPTTLPTPLPTPPVIRDTEFNPTQTAGAITLPAVAGKPGNEPGLVVTEYKNEKGEGK